MNIAFIISLALVVGCSNGCTTTHGPEPVDPVKPPPPAPNVDAGTPEPDATACVRMCATLDALGCKGSTGRRLADPTPGGKSCVDSCEAFERAAAKGIDLSMNPACVAEAKSCGDVGVCRAGAAATASDAAVPASDGG